MDGDDDMPETERCFSIDTNHIESNTKRDAPEEEKKIKEEESA